MTPHADDGLGRPDDRARRVARVVEFFESLSPAGVGEVSAIYADDAWFKDPFNEVRGVRQIERIFAHMFEQVDAPRFLVRETLVENRTAVLIWDFEFRFRRPLPSGQQLIRGCSHLRFAPDGRIEFHRDYWDAAEELYGKIPLLGRLMRLLRRRGSSQS